MKAKWIRDNWDGWIESYEPRLGSSVGIPDIQIVVDGILHAGARILRSAIDLEKAAANAASVPTPAGILKNNGADLG